MGLSRRLEGRCKQWALLWERRELVIAKDETERKTDTACRVPTGKGEERFLGRGALGMMDEFG
jgi:hypothetical protein